jgi:hypothetical protein
MLINNLTEYIPLICALDLYYPLIRLLLSYSQTQFDLSLYLLCYVTSIADDRSEEFGALHLHEATSSIVYIWLKKYWLSRYLGHALFSSSLDSIELISSSSSSSSSSSTDEFLNEIKHFHPEHFETKWSHVECLTKTIQLLGELPSLSLNESKQILQALLTYLTHVSYGSLVHVLLWLIANYQLANDEERLWIQTVIHSMGK